jgi:hypothetical protein
LDGGVKVVLGEAGAAVEEGEFDEDGDAEDVSAEGLDHVAAGVHGAAGGEEVVDDEAFFAGLDGVFVDFEGVLAVLEVVGEGEFGGGEFAGLADGDEAAGEGLGDGGAEDEAAGFGADDGLDALSAEGVAEDFDGHGEAGGAGEEGSDVLEHDAFFGEVGDVADEGSQVEHEGGLRRGFVLRGVLERMRVGGANGRGI